MKVKCLVQEHNTMTWPGLEPGPLDLESGAPLCLPHDVKSTIRSYSKDKCFFFCCLSLNAQLRKFKIHRTFVLAKTSPPG